MPECGVVESLKQEQQHASLTISSIFLSFFTYIAAFVFPLPVLANVEAPLEMEMSLLVVIDEAGDGVVVTAREHAGGSLLFLDCTRGVLVACGNRSTCVVFSGVHFLV